MDGYREHRAVHRRGDPEAWRSRESALTVFTQPAEPKEWSRRFDELLQNHLNNAVVMSCPPIRPSRISGESNYCADVVLAGPGRVGDPSEADYLGCRLELLARKLADALGLSERGHILHPRSVGTRSRRYAP